MESKINHFIKEKFGELPRQMIGGFTVTWDRKSDFLTFDPQIVINGTPLNRVLIRPCATENFELETFNILFEKVLLDVDGGDYELKDDPKCKHRPSIDVGSASSWYPNLTPHGEMMSTQGRSHAFRISIDPTGDSYLDYFHLGPSTPNTLKNKYPNH